MALTYKLACKIFSQKPYILTFKHRCSQQYITPMYDEQSFCSLALHTSDLPCRNHAKLNNKLYLYAFTQVWMPASAWLRPPFWIVLCNLTVHMFFKMYSHMNDNDVSDWKQTGPNITKISFYAEDTIFYLNRIFE